MTASKVFDLLFNGGNYSRHYLLEFSLGSTKIYLCNNNKDIVFNNKTYKASSFSYSAPDINGNNASLNITQIDNDDLFDLIENTTDNYKLSVIGVLLEGNEIAELENSIHLYGSVSCDTSHQYQFSLDKDDRLEMQFCVYKFDTTNNKANA